MSILSQQINKACNTNPDTAFCQTLNVVAPIVLVILAFLYVLALPFIIYSRIKENSKDDWSQKMAFFSGLLSLGIFLVGHSLQILKYLSGSVPIFTYTILPLAGLLPLMFKHPEILASIYPKEMAEINTWSATQKNVVAICVIAMIISVVLIAINY